MNATTVPARDRPLDGYLRLSDARVEEAFEGREANLRKTAEGAGRAYGMTFTENDIDELTGKVKPATAWGTRKVRLPGGRTARRVIRPHFAELLNRVTDGVSGGFVVEACDRAVRTVRDMEDLLDIVGEAGATVLSVSDDLTLTDGGTSPEISKARDLAKHAFDSSQDTSRRVKNAHARRVAKGIPLKGGTRRFGYEPDGITIREPYPAELPDGRIIIVDEAAELQAARDKVLSGPPALDPADTKRRRRPDSESGIVRDLNARGIPTVRGGKWSVNALRGMLLNPASAGILMHNGEIIRYDAWVGIFTVAEHEALAAVLKHGNRKTNPGGVPVSLLAGAFDCGRVIDADDVAKKPDRFIADRAGQVCGGRISSAGNEKGGPRTYGCRSCHRNSIVADPADVLVELVTGKYLKRHAELRRRIPVTVEPADKEEKIAALETQADEIMADRSKPRSQRLAEAGELDLQIKVLRAVQPIAWKPGRVDRITAAAFDGMDRDDKRGIISELFRITLLPGSPGRNTFDPSRVRITLASPDITPEQVAWLAECTGQAAAAVVLPRARAPRGPQARHEIACLNCGKRKMAGNSRAKFCGSKCRYAWRRDHPAAPDEQWERDKQRTCEVCGETFLAAKSTARYCPPPKDCTSRAYRQRYEDRKAAGEIQPEAKVYRKQCAICRETFETSRSGAKYCGAKCRKAGVRARRDAGQPVTNPGGRKRRYPRVCEQCGAGFMSAKPDGRFCTDNCRAKAHYRDHRTEILASRKKTAAGNAAKAG